MHLRGVIIQSSFTQSFMTFFCGIQHMYVSKSWKDKAPWKYSGISWSHLIWSDSICGTDTNLYQNSRFLLCLLFFHNSRFLLYLLFFHYNVCIVTGLTFHCLDILCYTEKKTSQVTYETMVPRVGNETLRPLGVAMGGMPSAWPVLEVYIYKNTC